MRLVTIVGCIEDEICDSLFVESDIPTDDDVVLRLRLLQFTIVISLQLDQRTENVLVLISILVSAIMPMGF